MKSKKKLFILFFTILISVFFRFYRLTDFQYFSVDEAILYLSARKIFVETKPILLAPNTNLGISLSPFFTYISAFIFWVTKSNPILVLGFWSFIGVISSFLMYRTGKLLFNTRIGLIVSFLYSSSFLISLFDRRWWALSLDSFLVILAIFSLRKILDRKYQYSFLLFFAASFAWHSDPSLLIISVAIFFSFLLFKLPLLRKQYLPALFWLFFSLSPFLVAEIRHPHSITQPLVLYFQRISGSPKINIHFALIRNIIQISQNFTRSLFTKPSKNIENHFFCIGNYDLPWFSPFSNFIFTFLLFLPIFWFFKKNQERFKKSIILLYIFIFSFLISIFIFNSLTKIEISQHYFVVIWPVLFLLIAASLEFLINKNQWLIVYLFLTVIFSLNLITLINSKMNYPLKTKLKVVEEAIKNINNSPFALYYQSNDFGFMVGGWESLFTVRGRPPSWDQFTSQISWTHQAYSLFPIKPLAEKEIKQKVKLFAPDIIDIPKESENIKKYKVEEVNIFIEK